MRRKDKEIIDPSKIEAIIGSAKVCRVGFSDNGQPYIVPMSFGYQDNVLYFHCAIEGRKLECIKKNPNVCFEFDEDVAPISHEKACRWSMKYQSIIGYGRVEFVRGTEDKRRALEIIMRQYSQEQFEFPETELENITVFKIVIDQMSGKQSGY
jgi:nitroimidazol reductase NimA-like FMN-containing flavoprotein (pyridoxamine 5'-phosphate oxidase superfamily)